ncbi:T9SS type B sorting domain-containing protein [Chryseobacterium chendengshani]|uniref:T9SS type B sorting domain-containing protein n=1 Tax=Chryseobacterium sp. LJ756 TaxID=2864113 RepID=UPI001C63EB3A|nr:gliding motility-associated C-terminal domain-containing protein [Chryseobacterium sp. LJ756]MBW7675734.1 gliding motility-associated C-terminal domain-containing protein [Chryseobacterium sp. LJ756]
MKKFLLSICTFLCLLVNAQLDTDHWFAPMAAKAGTNNLQSFLYLSTNETVPFSVQIYNNNTLYTTVQVSKGNPVQVNIPEYFLMAVNQADLFTPSSMGMYVKGPKKFFANYRFSVDNHAEIITSKGLAGLGTKFYAAMAPNTGSNFYINSTIGVTAIEDNTSVVVSGYDPNVIFSDGTSTPNKTFTLNRGQSYVMDVVSSDSPNNLAGLVGAKIESTKPVSVTNGNFNAIYTNQNFTNNDILMDQAVPVDRLGKDFVVVKGNGPATSGMETILVLATENNTTFTVNGAPSGVTLNAGQYFMVPGASYVNQGNNNFNMAISSTKNMYVYQLLAGVATGSIYATGGFNYIPPLSCFLPNKVDEIGFINQIGFQTYNTKLNIITQTGAIVTLNGGPIATGNGPYPVTGNANWVSYSIPNITGNITVNSTKSVTAGIVGGSGAVGYGGYFAGFSSVPGIAKTGDCLNGILLQVDNTYDAYQWFLNGNPIPGATTYFINPENYGAGNYTCLITKNNCDSKLTNVYSYTVCPPISTTTSNIGSCNTKVISPAFTSSTQTISIANTSISIAPTSGTAVINPTNGQITYTPNPGLSADVTDSFTYYIEGTGNPAAFEYFKVILNIDVLQVTNTAITTCTTNGTTGIFNLTSAIVTTDPGIAIAYFSDAALTLPITTPTSYSASAGIVYAKVTSTYGCSKVAQINLSLNAAPNITTTNFNGNLCDDNFDGIINVNFTTISPQIVTNSANFTVKYYLLQADATAGNANTLPTNWSYTANTTIYVRVESSNGCPAAFGQINFSIGAKISLLTQDYSTLLCDDNSDGTETVILDNFKNNFTTDPAVSLTYFNSLSDAQTGINAINATQTVAPVRTFYIRFQSTNACPQIAKLTLSLDTIVANNATLTACSNTLGNGTFNLTTANVTTTPGAVVTYFSDAAYTIPITTPSVYNSAASNVYVRITSPFGCTRTAQITLTVNPLANINTSNFNANICDDNFDGIINVNFTSVTPQIVTNSTNFTVKYYLNQADANAGNNNTLPANWTYTANTIVYVRVESNNNCPPAFGQINFTIGNKITLLTAIVNTQVCDNDLNGSETVNLNDYKNQFTTDPAVTLTFHSTLANAQAGTNAIAAQQVIITSGTYYIRFTSSNACPNTGTITITLKSGKKSDILKDQVVCLNEKAVLNAGTGFTSYLWSTGETTPIITVGAGIYYVDLGFNGCIYRQTVNVTTAQAPTITSIQVTGSNATINVSGGTAPYQYSLNGIDYQSSNTFSGLTRGPHTVYVLSADGCRPIIKEFLILNLVNAITPNGDGHNDVLNYSDLRLKQNVSIEVVDRYGAAVYKSSGKNYIWDGKSEGRTLSTGTYWYILKWIEPDTKLPVSHSGWLLIKNRE